MNPTPLPLRRRRLRVLLLSGLGATLFFASYWFGVAGFPAVFARWRERRRLEHEVERLKARNDVLRSDIEILKQRGTVDRMLDRRWRRKLDARPDSAAGRDRR